MQVEKDLKLVIRENEDFNIDEVLKVFDKILINIFNIRKPWSINK